MRNLNQVTTNEIDFIMDNFNFSRVVTVMEALNWRWSSTGDEVPTECEIRTSVRQMLNSFIKQNKENGEYIGSGGFKVSLSEDELVLEFIVEEWAA